MSYEGFTQRWCANDHYWTTPERYGHPEGGDRICPDCKEKNVAANEVDDTNCDAWGKVPVTDRLPALEEMEAHAKGHFWHRDQADSPKWMEVVGTWEATEQKDWWAWVQRGF